VINPLRSRYNSHGTEDNCLLSDVPRRDLRPGLDYTYDNDHILYAWKDLDPYCVVTGYSIDDDHVFDTPGSSRPQFPDATRPDFDSGPPGQPGVRFQSDRPNPRPFFAMPKPPPGHYHIMRPFDPDRPDNPVYHPGAGHNAGYDDKFGYGVRPSQGFKPYDRECRYKMRIILCCSCEIFHIAIEKNIVS